MLRNTVIETRRERPKTKVVVIGGGTGTATVLSGLKTEPSFDLTAIVPVSDQGGSSKEFVDAFIHQKVNIGAGKIKIVPPGDIANAMIALSSHPEELIGLLNYRYNRLGTRFSGHSLRNLMVDAALELWGLEGLTKLGELLRLKGRVVPATTQFMKLKGVLADGTKFESLHITRDGALIVLEGEEAIDYLPYQRSIRTPMRSVELSSLGGRKAAICAPAKRAIAEADIIVFAPSDLWTSTIPILLVPGMAKALKGTEAVKCYFAPLMTKRLHSDGFTAKRFVDVIEKHSFPGIIDALFLNTTPIPQEILATYMKEGAKRVPEGIDKKTSKVRVLRYPLLDTEARLQDRADKVHRSILRHDPEKILKAIRSLIR